MEIDEHGAEALVVIRLDRIGEFGRRRGRRDERAGKQQILQSHSNPPSGDIYAVEPGFPFHDIEEVAPAEK